MPGISLLRSSVFCEYFEYRQTGMSTVPGGKFLLIQKKKPGRPLLSRHLKVVVTEDARL